MFLNDNIAAISTPFGNGALAIIRISGKTSIEEINKIFIKKDLSQVLGNTIHYGRIIGPNKEIIDEVMISVFKNPKSYTGENMLEITTHGGILITNQVLKRVLEQDIRLAQPGEFTQRAYLNQKMDLVQAETIMDIIHAKNTKALSLAHKNLDKTMSKIIISLQEALLDVIAKIEVNLDYPEYEDAEIMTQKKIKPSLTIIDQKIKNMILSSRKNEYFRKGIKTVIVGKPNVGKSSLFNLLLSQERALVSNIAGTTRDFVDSFVNLNNNITLHLIDTAGIRKTNNKIEKMGIIKTKQMMQEADLVILLLDLSNVLLLEDKQLLEETKNYKRLIVGNKKDLPKKNKQVVDLEISTFHKKDLFLLEKKIFQLFAFENIEQEKFFFNLRQQEKLTLTTKALEEALNACEQKLPIDIINIDIRRAWQYLGEILGNHSYDNLLKELFSKFCLGK